MHAEGALGAEEAAGAGRGRRRWPARCRGRGRRAASRPSARRPARRSGRSRRWTGRWTGSRRSRRSRRTRRTAGSGRGSGPRSASSASASGPRSPGSRVAVIDDVVDRDQPLHPDQVEASTPAKPSRRGDQATDDRRAAAEGHHRDVVLDREREDGGDLVVAGRADDGVGGVGQVAGPGAEQVGRRLAAGAQPPGLVVGAHVVRRRRARGELGEDRGGRAPDGASGAGVDGGPVVERRRPSRPGRGPRRRGAAARSGSPQRDGCISVCSIRSCVTL